MKVKTFEKLVIVALLCTLGVIVGLRYKIQNTVAVASEVAISARSAQDDTKHVEHPEFTVEPTAEPTATPEPTPEATPTPEPEPTPEAEQCAAVLTADVPFIVQPEYGRYGSIFLHADEVELIARVVWQEARGESAQGQQAVAEVVLNRVLSPSFPGNVYDVIFDEGQFVEAPNLWSVSPTQAQYDAVSAALNGPNILPQQVLYFATSMNGRTQAWGWIGGHVFCY